MRKASDALAHPCSELENSTMLAAGRKQAGIHKVTQTDLAYLSGLFRIGPADDPAVCQRRRGFSSDKHRKIESTFISC